MVAIADTLEVLREVKRRIVANPRLWMRGSQGFTSDAGPCCVIGHVDRVVRERYQDLGGGEAAVEVGDVVERPRSTRTLGRDRDAWESDPVARGVEPVSPKEEKKALIAKCGPKDRVYSAKLQLTFIVREGDENDDFDAVCRRLFDMAKGVAKREDQTRAYLDLSVTWPKVKP